MWNIERINQYIENGIEENLHLDYKASGAISRTQEKKREISKDVSAFANSDGGIIIYGIAEHSDKDKKHLPERIDPISRKEYSKEWLEQIINSSISPRIQRIDITPVPIINSELDKVVYVVEIPKSDTAHQAKDKRYYKRYNFESIMMDDWEIKDVINRSNKTDIGIIIKTKRSKDEVLELINNGETFTIESFIYARNMGNIVCKFVELFVSGKKNVAKYILESIGNRSNDKFQLKFVNIRDRKIKIGEEELIIAKDRNPILPKTSHLIGSMKFSSRFILENEELEFLICTDDGSRIVNVKGIDILNGKPREK